MEKQVSAEHYDFQQYVGKKRWASYYHQIEEINVYHPETVLEVGVGAGILKLMLEFQGSKYKSIDIDPELNPDFIGSCHNLPFKGESFDVIGCFQVLEHLPFELFEKSLAELMRCAKKRHYFSTGRRFVYKSSISFFKKRKTI
jgi:ubiquinone/menaquinone biosynthesis C-methylase UbiE